VGEAGIMSGARRDRLAALGVLIAAAAVAAASACPWAGSWNDGSRLATVESLVDRHTWAIDDSIFVRAPAPADPAVRVLTQDKLLIDGRFYSDKPPVPAVLMAGLYQLWRWGGGAPARAQPGRFCYWMTLASSGLAYAVAVTCIFLLGQAVRLPLSMRATLTASFAFATVALPYARQVNGHVVLLAIAALLWLQLLRCAGDGRASAPRLLLIGSLAGLAYGVDLAAGPLLLASALGLIAYRQRSARAVLLVGLAALPWVALHQALNYAVGGTFVPANSVPAYQQWPGSPFDRTNMTGVWHHDGVGSLVYGVKMLVGRRGFLLHDLPLLLGVATSAALWRRRPPETPELVCGAAWSAGTWLAYALASNNYSGECVSIRWFVPLLAPGYLALAVALRERPRLHAQFLVLSGWGALLAAQAWWRGPWVSGVGPFFWPLQAAAIGSWIACSASQRRRAGGVAAAATSRVDGERAPVAGHG
jgi:hypothetical protein